MSMVGKPETMEMGNAYVGAMMLHPMICANLATHLVVDDAAAAAGAAAKHVRQGKAHYNLAAKPPRVDGDRYADVKSASHPVLIWRHSAFVAIGVKAQLKSNNVLYSIFLVQ